ncbi:MAG: carboxypeptidase regulatory-like domain-containing protein [Bacteroidia bacterium]|nr:carboxypeptidase regulatory-like domain-containing protein [Bacteroidia bacterium]
MTYVGYGTLKLPYGTFNNVALIRENRTQLDSIFVDLLNNGNYVFLTTNSGTSKGYFFARNNTFATNFLMYVHTNPANTVVEYAWYTLPTDIGTLSGIVYTDESEAIAVTDGEVYLYRENSNFTKNDILAKTTLDGNGYYEFDSIPYGEYRVAVRPNINTYPNTLITYVGDTTNWIAANTIITTTTSSTGNIIHLKNHPSPVGANGITGQLVFNSLVAKGSGIQSTKPVPGVGIVVKKNPGASERNVVTDANGNYNLGNLDDGAYKLFVDIPGLHMSGTYEFTVSGGNVVNSLDYTVGTDSIHPFSTPIGLIEFKDKTSTYLMAYPNPYNTSATIELNLGETNQISIEAYNMLGEKISTLDSGKKNAGTYKYSFSAKSQGYSAGMYFIKLTAGKTTKVIKLIEE